MTERMNEALSALMDGEVEELELRRLLKASAEPDSAVRQTWRRYHQQQALRSSDSVGLLHLDISARVADSLAQQPPLSTPVSAGGWKKPVASVAIAASVALAVFIAAPALQQQPASSQPVLTAQNSNPLPNRAFPVAATSATSGTQPASVQQTVSSPVRSVNNPQLEQYFLRHTEQAALNNGHGMMSFARVARFDIEAQP